MKALNPQREKGVILLGMEVGVEKEGEFGLGLGCAMRQLAETAGQTEPWPETHCLRLPRVCTSVYKAPSHMPILQRLGEVQGLARALT